MERLGRYTGIRQGWKYKKQKGQKPSFINDSLQRMQSLLVKNMDSEANLAELEPCFLLYDLV